MGRVFVSKNMKTSLSHTLRERRRSRNARHESSSTSVSPPPLIDPSDPAVERVRRAGGPVDQASYSCECGMQFVAPVSTSVMCPHCRAPQAW